MRRSTMIGLAGLEAYALTLANLQALGGVRTDEAKYLLNIPYPHPPLLRSIIHLVPFEMLWRIIFASLIVQAFWLFWDIGRDMHVRDRMMVAAGWLLASAVVLQTGSIMMAPLTALQVAVFLWLRSRPEIVKKSQGWIALFWLACLFSAYQIILFLPLVWPLFSQKKRSRWIQLLIIFGPVVLLGLYTLANPLVLASLFIHAERQVGETLLQKMWGTLEIWILGGSLVLSIAGTYAMFFERRWDLIVSFLLVLGYVFLSRHTYYAILFTPLFIEGLCLRFHERIRPHSKPLLVCTIAATIVLIFLYKPPFKPGPSRPVLSAIQARRRTGDIVINGAFGHDWQYESRFRVRRYTAATVPEAQAVICLDVCNPPLDAKVWHRLNGVPVETWVR